MLYFGPAGIPEGAGTSEEGIRLVRKMGLDALEVEFVRGVRMGQPEAKRLGELAAQLGVRLSAHAPYFINLNSKKPETIESSKVHILATMKAARDLDAKIIVVHAGFYSGMDSDGATGIILDGVRECREQADDEGCADVVLGLETMGKRASWGTIPEIKRVMGSVRRVAPVVDFAHMHARGQGCLRTREDFQRIIDDFEQLGAPFMHCHFTGIEYGQAGERRHLEVASAAPDFALLAPLLLGKGYDITLICESPLLEKDALLMKEMAAMAGREKD